MSLSTRVGKRHPQGPERARDVADGRPVAALGRLTTTDGSPVANQSIVFNGTLRRRARPPSRTRRRRSTDTGGRFSRDPARRAEPSLTLFYPGAPGILTRTRDVALRVPASAPSMPRRRHNLAAPAASASPAACGCSETRCPPGGKLVDLQAAQRGRRSRSPPPAQPAQTPAGTQSPASAAPRAATRSACASAARRCSPMNWGTPLP